MERRARFLAVAVLIVLAAGCTSAVAGRGPAGGPASGPAIGPAVGPAATASAPPVDTRSWMRGTTAAADLGGGPTSTLAAVLAPQQPGAPWIVAGTRLASDGSTKATVWSSPDASRWTSTTLAGHDGRILAATTWGRRTVLVGSVEAAGRARAAVWMAPGPGQPFAPVPAAAALQATAEPATSGPPVTGTASMDVVAAGAQGVFAAGSVSGRQAVWYSTDGTTWVRLTGAERVMDGVSGTEVTSMLVTPTGVVAAGTVPDGTYTDAAVWTSSDGISWRRTPPAGAPFGGDGDHRIDGLAMESDGLLVAVGAVRSGPEWVPASWVSPGGGQWGQPSEALPSTSRPQPSAGGVVRAVTTTVSGSGLVAVGGSGSAQSVWTSTDGLDWASVPLPVTAADSSGWTAGLVATDGSTTVVADAAAGQPRVLVQQAGRWTETSADPAIFGSAAAVATPAGMVDDAGRLVLAVDIERAGAAIGGPDTSNVAILQSSNGIRWRLLARGGALAGARIEGLAAAGGSLVAVGTAPAGNDAAAAAMWTSTTGRRWTLAALFGGRPDTVRQASTVAALGREAVVAGTGPASTDAGVDAVPTAQSWTQEVIGWTARGALDADTTPIDGDEPLGSCSLGHTVVVVGQGARHGVPRSPHGTGTVGGTSASTVTPTSSVAQTGSPAGPGGQGDDGTIAMTWTTTGAGTWTAGTVSPLSGDGGAESMQGCSAVGTGFVAWGQTPAAHGRPAPALWTSSDGIRWTLEATPTLHEPGSSPLTDLARLGRSWFAVGGGTLAATATPTDPTALDGDPNIPAAASPSSSGPDGTAALWYSADAGTTWARVATSGPVWATAGLLSTDLVATLGGRVVVAGQVDGRLATWAAAVPGTTGT